MFEDIETDSVRQSSFSNSMPPPRPPLRVVFLPNVRMKEKRGRFQPGTGPNPQREIDGFITHGVIPVERDLNRWPWNPLAGKGAFFAGFDPLRAFVVMIRERHADIIVSTFESNIFLILLLKKIFRFKPKIVLWDLSGRGWTKRDRVLDYIVPRVDRVFALTVDQQRKTDARYKLRAPAELIGFAIDDNFFMPTDQKQLDLGYVLAVGDDIGRDYPLLIEACRGMRCKLILRTSSHLAIPDDMKASVSLVGRVSYAELRDLYAGARMVVVPLRAVDYPSGITAIFEAMAMGKAVIASTTGTTKDFISNKKTGILVAPGNTQELRDAILALLDDATLCGELGANARRAIENHLSYENYIANFAASLAQIVESSEQHA